MQREDCISASVCRTDAQHRGVQHSWAAVVSSPEPLPSNMLHVPTRHGVAATSNAAPMSRHAPEQPGLPPHLRLLRAHVAD